MYNRVTVMASFQSNIKYGHFCSMSDIHIEDAGEVYGLVM